MVLQVYTFRDLGLLFSLRLQAFRVLGLGDFKAFGL